MKLVKLLATSLALSTAVLALPAHAILTTYTDRAAFQAAAGATSLETFNSAVQQSGTGNYSGSFNGFSLSSQANGNLSGIVDNVYNNDNWPPADAFKGQNFYAWGSWDGGYGPITTFTFDNGITAFGFDFFNTDTTDNYTVTVNGSTQTVFDYDSSGFFGIIASAGETFTTATIQADNYGGYVSTAGLDNVLVSAAGADVPEPASIALFGIALIGITGARRKARK